MPISRKSIPATKVIRQGVTAWLANFRGTPLSDRVRLFRLERLPPNTETCQMEQLAKSVYDTLTENRQKLVLAESCTAGLVAATLGRFPGVSTVLCGSAVVYQSETKSDWLGIAPSILTDEAFGPVSAEVTDLLALKVLKLTSLATIGTAVTGHLGPTPEVERDGQVFVSVAKRTEEGGLQVIYRSKTVLESAPPLSTEDYELRYRRQCEAVRFVYEAILKALHESNVQTYVS